jgi:hypothetical protein
MFAQFRAAGMGETVFHASGGMHKIKRVRGLRVTVRGTLLGRTMLYA